MKEIIISPDRLCPLCAYCLQPANTFRMVEGIQTVKCEYCNKKFMVEQTTVVKYESWSEELP